MIKYINVEKIESHPDNPRKDLGEIDELAESIKVSGILQNLTVVPWFSSLTKEPADDDSMDDMYRVVIGHRRLAAARLAGLEEVPCVVADMDYKTQVATMLLENMQRSDLTVYEQAQGFQMMMDLGESVTNISEKTGFGESTVRRRIKLLELDKDKFKESVERGATLMDYVELEKINDPELKNDVLDKIGTSDFKWKLKSALDQEEKDKTIAEAIATLETFAEKIENPTGKKYVKAYYPPKIEIEIPEDADVNKYYFLFNGYGITMYKDVPVAEDQVEVEPDEEMLERERLRERRMKLEALSKQAFELRYEFVKNYSGCKKAINSILQFTVCSAASGGYCSVEDDLIEMLEIEINTDDEDFDGLTFDMFSEKFNESPYRCAVVAAYCACDDSDRNDYSNWECKHIKNEPLNMLYDCLIKLGYEMSDEEKALRSGTHELFVKD